MNPSQAVVTALWVSLEGPEGVGKTRLARRLAHHLGTTCRLLDEITDTHREHVPTQVVTALAAAGDAFLRTGHPLTETFALLALKAREHEAVERLSVPPQIVLEDRGIDTVAVYQAVILLGADATDEAAWSLTQHIFATAAHWCPLPDLTVLLVDDLDTCAQRWAEREDNPLTTDQRHLVARATRLYHRLVEYEPDRYRVLDRAGRSEDQAFNELTRIIHQATEKRGIHVEAS